MGNNVTLTCDGNFSPLQTLCKDGNYCNNLTLSNPTTSSASPQDNVSFVPSGVPVNVEWEVINPDTTSDPPVATPPGQNDNPVSYSIDGIGTFSLLEGVTDTKTQTATSPPAVKIEVNHTGVIGNEEFGVIRYRVKCTPVPAKLTILKNVSNVVNDPTQFDFTSTIAPVSFMLTDGGAGQVFTTTGAYTITELAEAGYTLTSVQCTGTGANAMGDFISVPNRNTVVNLDPGDDISWMFTNTKDAPAPAKLTILKDVSNVVNDPTQFDFTSTIAPVNFMLTDSGAGQVFTTTGAYTITELAEAGEYVYSVQCTGTGANAMGDSTSVANRNTVVNLDPGDDITCTFTNTKDGAAACQADHPEGRSQRRE